jgi:hypothetical protein
MEANGARGEGCCCGESIEIGSRLEVLGDYSGVGAGAGAVLGV